MQSSMNPRVAAPSAWRERVRFSFELLSVLWVLPPQGFRRWRDRFRVAAPVTRPARRLAIGLGIGAFGYALLLAPVVIGGESGVALWVADRDGDQLVGMDKDFFVQRSVPMRSPVRIEAMGDGGTFALSAIGDGPIGKHALMYVDRVGVANRVGVLGAGVDLAPGPDGGVFVVELGLGGAPSRVLRGMHSAGGVPHEPGGLIEFAVLPGAICVAAQHDGGLAGGSVSGALRVLVGADSGLLSLLGEGAVSLGIAMGIAVEVGDVAPAPDGGWWVLDVAAPSRLLRLDRDLNLMWGVATGLAVGSLAPVAGEERVWLADTTEPLIRRFGPAGALELSVPIVSSDLSRGAGRADGSFWLASPGAALRLDTSGAGMPGQGGFNYLTDLSAVSH